MEDYLIDMGFYPTQLLLVKQQERFEIVYLSPWGNTDEYIVGMWKKEQLEKFTTLRGL